MVDLVGQYFGNKRVIRLLGRSAFSEVYLIASDSSQDQSVLKVLRVELSEADQEYFILASRTLTDLEHPHIIKVTGAGIIQPWQKYPALFMEYAPNGTLRQRHPIGSRVPLATILAYTRQIAEALHYAHLKRLTHGDVRPENILLGSDDQLLLGDFSFSLLATIKQIEHSTTAYMAPEQFREQTTPLSDEYALGVMVYEWLTGELPFSGSLSEIAEQHLVAPPPPMRSRVSALQPDVERVVQTALAKDPGGRFTNVLAFANALEQASGLTHLPLPAAAEPGGAAAALSPSPLATGELPGPRPKAARKTGVVDPSPRSQRHISRRAIIAGIPLLVVAGGGIFTWAWLLSQRAPATTPVRTTTAQIRTLLTYRGQSGEVTAVAWSPNGRHIASGGNDSTIRVWNASTGADQLVSHGHSGGIPAITWSPDSTRIASMTSGPSVSGGPPASDNSVHVLNATTGNPIYIYHGHSSGITDVAWSPRGERIASSSTDYTVQVWNAANGENPLIYRTHAWYVWTLAWSPDGKRLASGGPDGTISLWDAVSGHTFLSYRGHINAVEAITWSPDGKFIASASDDYSVRIWNSASGKLVYSYHGHSSYVRAVAWSPDGHSIASGSNDKTVQVWDSASGKMNDIYRGHSGAVTAVVWSPGGRVIASGSTDGTVQLWQVPL